MFDAVIYEDREPPADASLIEAARANPGGWVYDIDYHYRDEEEPPMEAIRGAWEVSESGKLTGKYGINSRFRPITICTRPLKPYMHAAAKSHPGGWVAEIDPRGEDLFPNIPEKFIVGWWLIGKNGLITQYFRENSLYIDKSVRI